MGWPDRPERLVFPFFEITEVTEATEKEDSLGLKFPESFRRLAFGLVKQGLFLFVFIRVHSWPLILVLHAGCYATSLVFWYWFFVGPALLLAILSLRGERKRAAYVERRLAETPHDLPPASVIVPVKGADHQLRENLAALAAQDYPDYELMVVAHSAADIPPGVLPSNVHVVLAHGDDPSTGEKVQNLRVAVTVPPANAARFLPSPIPTGASRRAGCAPWWRRWPRRASARPPATAGSRPIPPTFWTLLRSVWDAVALSRLGPGDCGFAWGGAMAIRRAIFHELDIRSQWKGTVSDDYALSAAVHAAGSDHRVRSRRHGALP